MAKPQKETLEHRQAFELYLSMGKDRSTAHVARELGKSKAAIDGWSSAFKWQERLAERERAIADKAAEKIDNRLADANAKNLMIANAVKSLFAKRLKEALDADGKFVKGGYKPSAIDAKVWAELERDILDKGSGGGPLGVVGFSPEALEGIDLVKLERIVIERATRIVAIRKGGASGSGE